MPWDVFAKQCAKREPPSWTRGHPTPASTTTCLKRVLRESQCLLQEKEPFSRQRKGLDVVFYNKSRMKAFIFVICKLLGSTFLCGEGRLLGMRGSHAKLLFPVRN